MVFRNNSADRILSLIKEKGPCASHFIIQETGLTEAGVRAMLTKLKKQNKLEKLGTGKSTVWKARRGW